MKIKVKSAADISQGDIRRLVSSLDSDLSEYEQHTFSVMHPYNCAILKMLPISRGEDLIAQYVLSAATVSLFALSVGEEHRGWFFMLPQHGNALSVPSGVIYMRPDLARLKNEYLKRVKVVEGEIKALDPEIYLPHSDFSIYGLDAGAILFISRNSTWVVTQ